MSYVHLGRDPFARGALVRRTVPPADRRPCAWCGGAPGRFVYGWLDDQNRPTVFERHAFCSKGCRDAHRG